MKHTRIQYLQSLLPYAFIGGILAAFYLVWLENETPIRGTGLVFVLLYLWVFFSIAAYLTWTRVLVARLALYTRRWKAWWLAGSLLAGFWLADNIPVVLPASGLARVLLFVCSSVGLGLVIFGATLLFVTRFRPPLPVQPRRLRWLVFALPMIAVWLVYLLIFWPGLMSGDSLDQWGQMLTGHYVDHHPAFHTFTIWLLTRIALTPAVVAIAQIVALALVAGALLAYIESLGLSSRWVWLACVVFALSPVNGTMVNTLWKDVPYSTAVLGFTYLILRLAQSRGQWLAWRGAWLALGITAALAALLRQNGLTVTAGSLLLLLLVFRAQWKPLLAALALCLALYYGITGPVYQLAGVQKSTALAEAAGSLYSLAATADPGSPVDALFLSMNPLSNSWQCEVKDALYQAAQNSTDQPEALPTKAVNLVEHGPSLLAFDYRCNRSLAWIIWDPNGELRNPSHAEYGIDGNAYGLAKDSKLPTLQQPLIDFVKRSAYDPNINWLVWRPALYQYLFLLVAAVIALRQKNASLLLIAAPVLIQSIGMTLVSFPPNFRYHYAVYLIALASWPILFLPYVPPTGAQPDSNPVGPQTHD